MSPAVPTTVEPVDELLERIAAYNPRSDTDLIKRAYEFGKAAHAGVYRKSGEPYFNHPIEVAKLLTEVRIDDASIVTALLHDTIEDTSVDYDLIVKEFGVEIAELVSGVTKLTKLQLSAAQNAEAENLRKLLIAMSKDVRVLLVKLADRLHNMRTIKFMRPEKQEQKARETMDIYAPLAGRMGMQYLRDELEDLSFQVLNPTARESVMRKFITLRGSHHDLLQEIIEEIEKVLAAQDIRAQVFGREKRPYSIWRKIKDKSVGFERLSDVYGFRIITEDRADCYRALGAVHMRWSAIPGRFKDYISQPKSNGYRSIHTVVSGRDGKRIEIQIRTHNMHIVAESGIAAHWSYKDGVRVENPYIFDPTEWFKRLNEGLLASDDDDEFMEHFRKEMYLDQVFVFSPKGKVVQLPRGSNAIDFAYAIHSNVGNHAVGAIIDGKRVPLTTKLRNGQTIQILQAKEAKPQKQWEAEVQTGRARIAIKRALKEDGRKHRIALGRSIAEVSFNQIDKKLNDKVVDRALSELGIESPNALFGALGDASLSGKKLVAAVYPELANAQPQDLDPVVLPPLLGDNPIYASRPCEICFPIPGDRVIGLARKGEGICYHVADCRLLGEAEDDDEVSWLDLKWPDSREGAKYPCQIAVTMANDAGVLGRICSVIGENHANIEEVEFTQKRTDFYTVRIEVTVRDKPHLENILAALNVDNAVSHAERYRQDSSADEPNDETTPRT